MARRGGCRLVGAACRRIAVCAVLLAACLAGLSSCVYSDTITEVIYDQKLGQTVDYEVAPVYVSAPDAERTSDEQPLDTPNEAGADDRVNEELLSSQSNKAAAEQDPRIAPETPPETESAPTTDDPASGATSDENQAQSGEGDSLDEEGAGNQHDDSSAALETVAGDDNSKAPAKNDPSSNTDAGTKDSPSSDDAKSSTENDSSDSTKDDRDESGSKDGDTSSEDGQDEGSDDNEQKSSDDGSSDGTESTSESGGEEDADNSGGDNGGDPESDAGRAPGVTFGEDGADDELPENVRRVAAVGNAAIACAVVGGADDDPNLVAADAELLSGPAASVLEARGISEAQVAWDADGTDAGEADLDLLLGLNLDACLITSGDDTLSEEEQAALTDAGVNIVYMPRMDSEEAIVACVRRMGTLLEKGGDASAAGVAADYIHFHDEIVGHAADLGSADVCALYVDDWVDDATYIGPLSSQIAVGGIAMAPVGLSAQPMSAYLLEAGVTNPAIEKARYQLRTGRAVVWPFIGGTNDSDWIGISNVNGGKGTQGNDYELALTRLVRNDEYFDLGTDAYPALIVDSPSTQESIVDDRDDEGVYSAQGHDSTSIASDDYDVYVNPCGLFSSWTGGSLESVLETAWASYVFQSDEDDGGYLEDRVRSFYSDFYGYELGDEYDGVVDGEYAG